jgi:amino acid adenylation domain-containing protein
MIQVSNNAPSSADVRLLDSEDVFVFPASFAQQRLWFLDQLEPGSPFYNIPAAVRLSGQLDVAAFERGLNEVVRRHEGLRTTFATLDDQPVQVIVPELRLPLPLIDLRALPLAEREREVRRRATAEARTPFDLAHGPLLRATLLCLDATEHILLLTMHHIISDGWSVGVLVGELNVLYRAFSNGRPSSLPELPIQYADFAEWQRGWLQGEVLEAQISYWKQQLAGATNVLELPTDRPRPALQSSSGASFSLKLPVSLTEELKALGQREGATLFMTLLAAFQTLLYRYSGQEDICVGTPIANRTRAELEPLIGLFINTLVLRGDLSGEPSFRELLQRVRQASLGAFAHQDLPFEMLVEALQPERDLSRTPLFQVMFILQNAPTPSATHRDSPRQSDLLVSALDVDSGTATFDLTLSMAEQVDGLDASVEYSTDLFDAATIERMLGHFQTLLEAIVADPDVSIAKLALLTAAERQTLAAWSHAPAPFALDRCVHQLFEAHAASQPDAPALTFEGDTLTYAALNARANQLAHLLRARGAGPETLVAICLDRSLDLVVAVLAVLKAGAAYLPLDPSYPPERLAFMLADSRAALLIGAEAESGAAPAYRALAPAVPLLDLVAERATLAAQPIANPDGGATLDQLAYVIYTSGSTGQAKGVMVGHRSFANAALAWELSYDLRPSDCHLQMASCSFDVFGGDLVRALCTGGRLLLVARELLLEPTQLAALIRRERATCAEFVPAVLRGLMQHLAQQRERLDMMRLLACGSDTWYAGEYQQFQRQCGATTRLINSFGLTEATVDSTYFEPAKFELSGEQHVPIGRPFAGSAVYILDRQLEPLPIGVAGELHIGGAGLARGYLGRPELTAEKFIPNPFVTTDDRPFAAAQGRRLTTDNRAYSDGGRWSVVSGRLYKTGDRARFLADGNIEFLGRLDQQVKIRGYRIEPAEIEALLLEHDRVQAAAVVARADAPGGARLVGYVVPTNDQRRTTNDELAASSPLVVGRWSFVAELRGFLQERLPEYMVPSLIVELERLPLTPNGKVDRQGLPAPDWTQRELEQQVVAPRTPVEELLAGIWSQVLGVEQVGVHDNFFELGGHSLLATQLIARVRAACQAELPLRTIFEAPTVAGLAERVEIAQRTTAGVQAPPIRKTSRDAVLPLSFAQQRLWFLDQLEPNSAFYNIPEVVRLNGQLDLAALEQSLNEIVRRHEILRTTFVTEDGQPRQVIAPELRLPLPLVDLRHLPLAQRESELRRLATEEISRPFDLARRPLLRAAILRMDDDEHVVVLNIHHIISDDWSTGVLIGEVVALYVAFSKGQPSPLPELPIQYADFAAWQRGWLQGEALEAQLDYWKQQLGGAPPLLELPVDRPRPPVQSYAGAYQIFSLAPELSAAIRAFNQREGVTLFMTLLAAFQALLARYSRQDDISVGTPIANRTRAELEGLIGFFVNTLVLRTDLSGEPSFRELARRAREVCLGAYAHQDLPFEMLVDALQPRRNLSHSPLFQVMIALQNTPVGTQELPGLQISPVEAHSGTAKFDMTLFIGEEGDRITGALEYNTDLFDAATIERMLSHFQALLEQAIADPEQPIASAQLLGEHERRQLLLEWNATDAAYPRDTCVHTLFEEQVVRTPAADAVVYGGRRLTYAELNARSNQLAHHLRELGIGPDQLVGVCVERSPELVIGLLGVLKAGAAYLPLDPSYPPERLSFMLEDAQVAALLVATGADSDPAILDLRSAIRDSAAIVDLAGDWDTIARYSTANPGNRATPDNLAYVIYTSGSTGRPKGAMIVHRGLTNYLTWAVEAYSVAAGAGAPLHSSIAFDLTVTSVFAPLLAGRLVHLLPEQPGIEPLADALLEAETFSLVKITPAHLELLSHQLAPQEAAGRTRAFIIGGENLLAESLRFWLDYAPDTLLVNEYGPTETVVGCCVYTAPLDGPRGGSIPIGRPIANTQLYVLDPSLQPVPIGVPGELYIGGDGLARGYLDRPELTAERFVPNPFARIDDRPPTTDNRTELDGGQWSVVGGRLYKTGDLARYRADGNLEFLGRLDQQVKLRGFRIELGEIEAVVAQHPAVSETIVVVREDAPGDKRLVAYVVPTNDERTFGSAQGRRTTNDELADSAPLVVGHWSLVGELRAFLKAKLPEYMIPSAFVMLEAIPLTPNGKVDRKALPAPDSSRRDLDTAYIAPRTPSEALLAEIWAGVIGVERVGVEDNFFELGGDSILSIQAIARANQAGLRLTPRQLFETPTVAGLAELADAAPPSAAEQDLVNEPSGQQPSAGDESASDFADFGWSADDLADIMSELGNPEI